MLAHGLLYVGKGNLEHHPGADREESAGFVEGLQHLATPPRWTTTPNSPMRQWRHDDEAVAYPTFELIEKIYQKLKRQKPGFNNICVHKGLAAGHPDSAARPSRATCRRPRRTGRISTSSRITRASSRRSSSYDVARRRCKSGKLREGVPDISWTTEYALRGGPSRTSMRRSARRGRRRWSRSRPWRRTSWGSCMKFMGPDRIVFGSDSVWYGSPQWQIDALWRFQIPEDMRKKYGYPGAHPRGETEDPRTELGEAVRHQGSGIGRSRQAFQAGAGGLREADDERAEDDYGVSGLHRGQHVAAQGAVRAVGSGAEQHTLRVDPNPGVREAPEIVREQAPLLG